MQVPFCRICGSSDCTYLSRSEVDACVRSSSPAFSCGFSSALVFRQVVLMLRLAAAPAAGQPDRPVPLLSFIPLIAFVLL